MKTALLFTLLALSTSLTGCGKQMKDFVDQAKKTPPLRLPATPDDDEKGRQALKYSGGSVIAKGNTTGMAAGISASRVEMKGSQVGMRIGISRAPAAQD